jgi:FMN phosphatase YigB (HAD superfamily)
MKLFLDLDGVLADFDRGVHEVTGKRPEELPLKTMWARFRARRASSRRWRSCTTRRRCGASASRTAPPS